MIVSGNVKSMSFIDGKDTTLENVSSGIFFGGNGAGKTELFNRLNKKIYYRYSDFHKNAFIYNGQDPFFINASGNISRIKRDKFNTNFDFSIANEFSRLSFKVHNKILVESGLDHISGNLVIPVEGDTIKIANNEFFFEHFPHSLNEFRKIITFMIGKSKTWNDKQRSFIRDSFLYQSKIYGIKNYFSNEAEIKKYNKFIGIIVYLKEGALASIIRTNWGIEETINFIARKYIIEVKSTIDSLTKFKTLPTYRKINKQRAKKYLTSMRIPGRSLGKDRCNKIISNIIKGISVSNTIVLDDPYDGMDLNTQRILSEIFSGLLDRNINIFIFTNSITGLRFLKHKNSKLNTFLMIRDSKMTTIENVSELDNIIFKYNNKRYYEDLGDLFNNDLVSYEIRELVLALHREVFENASKLCEFMNINHLEIKNKNTKSLKEWNYDIYDELTNSLKLKGKTFVLKVKNNKQYSPLSKYISNVTESKIFNLIRGNLNDELFRNRYGETLFSTLISKTLVVSLYESAANKILKIRTKWKKDVISQRKISDMLKENETKLKDISRVRDYIAHPQEHIFVWTIMHDANWSKIYNDLFYIINKLENELAKLIEK